MKIYTKIVLFTFPLIIIPAVIVGLVSFRISQAAVQSMAQGTLNNQLSKAMDICTEQANNLQGIGEIDSAQTAAANMIRTINFGNTGYIMVVDAAGFVLSHPVQQTIRQNISGEAWFYDIYDKDRGSFSFTWEGKKRLAQFQRFPDWGWYVISSETEDELLGPVARLGVYISGLLVISSLIAFLAILLLARRLTIPIQALLAGTERVRRGELAIRIGVRTNDEIGTLANAFNSMTDQLREVIGSLEQRVSARTRDLELRALQMQTASEIAREAVSTHELDSLLARSVNLIQERFNFYYVSIYTPDEQRQFVVLRAGSGEIGAQMVQRGFRVRIGDVSIVSHVASTGEPRVVNDVKTDFTYVKHPLLPDTACAAALPIKVGSRIIGVLDVESHQANVLTQDNTAVLQTLADQLAVAIENARLLEELRNSLRETRSLYQRYTQDSWSRAAQGRKYSGYQFDLSRITSLGLTVSASLDLPEEARTRLMEGHAIPIPSALIAPLIMYDQVIGILGVENDNPNHIWTPEEITLLEAISNQVSLTLDNARLVEETQRHSEQIRLLQEITAEAASHVNLNELLEAVTQRLLTGYNLLSCGVSILDRYEKAEAGTTHPGVGRDGRQPPDHLGGTNPYGDISSTIIGYAAAPGTGGLHSGENRIGTKLPPEHGELIRQMLSTQNAVVVYGTQELEATAVANTASDATGEGDTGIDHLSARKPSDGAYSADARSSSGELPLPHPCPTVLMVPLVTRGDPFGIIIMEIADPDRQFNEDDLRLLEQIGLQISTAIEVARNFEQTANRAEYERLIGEMTTHIRETLDVESMLKTAVKEVQQALGLPEVIIRLGSTAVNPTATAVNPTATAVNPTATAIKGDRV